MQITSPNGSAVEVSDLNRLLVEAGVKSMGGVFSELGKTFSWSSTFHDILMDETVLLLKNTYDGHYLVVDKIIGSGEAPATIHMPANASFSGTAITGVALNQNYNYVDNVDAYQHEIVNNVANVVLRHKVPFELNFKGEIRIGNGKCVAVDYHTETYGAVTIIGHFEE